uniref:Uncharacterized protein n=1 Tax=Oryza rufipogon TaxID=4529 RepID=A0A0E0PWP1_ORYRU
MAADGDGARAAVDGGDEPKSLRLSPLRPFSLRSCLPLPWEGGVLSLARILRPSSPSMARPRSRSMTMGRRHRTSSRRGFRRGSSPPPNAGAAPQPPRTAAQPPSTAAPLSLPAPPLL